MKRYLAVMALALAAAPGWAQDKTAKPAAAPPPPPPPPPANLPVAKAPAAKTAENTPAAGAPANTPAATNAPAGTGAATSSGKTIAVRVPSGGDYTAYIQEAAGTPKKIEDHGDLDVPAGSPKYTVYVLDNRTGYAARKQVEAKAAPAELSFAAPDFNLVQKVAVHATGKDNKPIAQGTATLTDSKKNQVRKVLSQGSADFDFVPSGSATVAVTADDAAGPASFTRSLSIDLPKGETVQSILVPIPQVTKVIEGAAPVAAGSSSATGAAPATGNAPAATAPPPAPPAGAPAAAPTATPPAATPAVPAPSGGTSFGAALGNLVIMLIQFAIVIGLIVAGFLYAKKQGWTVETVLKKMGVQPDTVGANGANLAGANMAQGVAAPGTPPAPPPIVADPNQCPYCGQMKDAAGNCGCMVTAGSRGGAAASTGGATGTGPRLVGMQGVYMGSVFPIHGTVIMGRDPSNPVALDRDTTTSRRHVQITDQGGSYYLQDLGSSNGTFVNGSRVTECALSPGDEIAVGGTRFRFEV